tara:strand:- start:3457 stop:4674 length:1218 start_codon:yes stop_codon:yes gene_type:complete
MMVRNIGFGVWLYEETGSGLQLGLIGIVQLAVQMPAILFGGSFADWIDRKKLIAVTQSFSFLLISIATILLITDELRPMHIFSIVGILGVTSTMGGPARSAMTANVVPETHLMHAVTSNTATFQISAIITPLVFSLAYSLVGLVGVFALGIIFSIPATIMPLLIDPLYGKKDSDMGKAAHTSEKKHHKNHILNVLDREFSRIWAGFTFVKQHPILPGLYIMDIGVTVFSYYREIMPLIVDRLFRQGSVWIGPLTAANSLGGVAGSFLVLFMANFRAKGQLVLIATGLYALLLFAFGSIQFLSANPITLVVVGGVIIASLGASDAVGMTTRQTTVQLTTPDDMRGRAVSFHSFSAMSANNLGTFEIGFMSSRIGAGNTMLLGGCIAVIVVITVWRLIPGLRNYRYP